MGNVKKNKAKGKAKKVVVKKTRAQKIDEMFTALLWSTNDPETTVGLPGWEVDFSDMPTPQPDFEFIDTFDEVFMECDRVIGELREAVTDRFIKAAAARGLSEKAAWKYLKKYSNKFLS